ncbi:hypothetical protein G7046_g2089 [Stylonectria norvegica]|nr:hypothetical protein G7046_g2089 [Stylonectria norvegica]
MVLGHRVKPAEDSFRSGCTCASNADCQYTGCLCLAELEEDDEDSGDDPDDMDLDGHRVQQKAYAYHAHGSKAGLLRSKFHNSKMPIYECHQGCSCSFSCPNRVVERGRTVPLQIFRTKDRGWGVRSPVFIKKGQFVDRYLGEVITSSEADRRRSASAISQRKDVYLFALDKFTDPASYDPRLRGPPLEVDGEFMSGPTRFVNHSCDPNMRIFARVGDHADKHLHDLALFAIKDIPKGEELTFDYVDGVAYEGGEPEEDNIGHMTKCLCGNSYVRNTYFLLNPSMASQARENTAKHGRWPKFAIRVPSPAARRTRICINYSKPTKGSPGKRPLKTDVPHRQRFKGTGSRKSEQALMTMTRRALDCEALLSEQYDNGRFDPEWTYCGKAYCSQETLLFKRPFIYYRDAVVSHYNLTVEGYFGEFRDQAIRLLCPDMKDLKSKTIMHRNIQAFHDSPPVRAALQRFRRDYLNLKLNLRSREIATELRIIRPHLEELMPGGAIRNKAEIVHRLLGAKYDEVKQSWGLRELALRFLITVELWRQYAKGYSYDWSFGSNKRTSEFLVALLLHLCLMARERCFSRLRKLSERRWNIIWQQWLETYPAIHDDSDEDDVDKFVTRPHHRISEEKVLEEVGYLGGIGTYVAMRKPSKR